MTTFTQLTMDAVDDMKIVLKFLFTKWSKFCENHPFVKKRKEVSNVLHHMKYTDERELIEKYATPFEKAMNVVSLFRVFFTLLAKEYQSDTAIDQVEMERVLMSRTFKGMSIDHDIQRYLQELRVLNQSRNGTGIAVTKFHKMMACTRFMQALLTNGDDIVKEAATTLRNDQQKENNENDERKLNVQILAGYISKQVAHTMTIRGLQQGVTFGNFGKNKYKNKGNHPNNNNNNNNNDNNPNPNKKQQIVNKQFTNNAVDGKWVEWRTCRICELVGHLAQNCPNKGNPSGGGGILTVAPGSGAT